MGRVELTLCNPQHPVVRQPRRRGQSGNYSCQTQHERINHNTEEPYFGHGPGPVPENWVRIGSVNIDNLATHGWDESDARLCSAIQEYELEACLLQETGVNWSVIPKKRRWANRCKKFFEPGSMQARFGHNVHDVAGTPKQWGGTGIVSQGKLKHYASGAGTDASGLGRWTWATFRGKGTIKLRIVSVYQPCKNLTGITAVYAQHKAYLQDSNDDRDPRTAFKEDLKEQLDQWIEEGDQLIVAGDLNESVFGTSITNVFNECNMRNATFSVHNRNDAPTTHFRTSSNRTVDGMWVTPGLKIQRCGYLEPRDFPGNLSMIWADIAYDDALGHNPPMPKSPDARRLKLQYPDVVHKYLSRYCRLTLEHDLER